jgi:hypothetical protein
MTAIFWRALFLLVVIVLLTQNILLWHAPSKAVEPTFAKPAAEHKPTTSSDSAENQSALKPDHKDWTYEPLRHAENFALDHQQCDIAFPGLWHEIDRSVSFWKNNISRTITANDTSLGWR